MKVRILLVLTAMAFGIGDGQHKLPKQKRQSNNRTTRTNRTNNTQHGKHIESLFHQRNQP